jgi:hypothetical protein
MLYTFLIFLACITCPAHIIIFHFIIVVTCGKGCNLCSFALLFRCPVGLSLLVILWLCNTTGVLFLLFSTRRYCFCPKGTWNPLIRVQRPERETDYSFLSDCARKSVGYVRWQTAFSSPCWLHRSLIWLDVFNKHNFSYEVIFSFAHSYWVTSLSRYQCYFIASIQL